jgi:hypothetical protein
LRSVLGTLLVVAMLSLAACGSSSKDVDTSAYTCGQFNKSLRTKGDNTSGNFINQLRKEANLNQTEKVERSELTLGIIVTCRNKPASTRPRAQAIAIAKLIKAGNYKLPRQAGTKKKSSN